MITNPIYQEFLAYGLINPSQVEKIADATRDMKIPVYIDKSSKIIFLESCKTTAEYYQSYKVSEKQEDFSITDTATGAINTPGIDDDLRRAQYFKEYFQNKDLLDFGCGWGGFLKLAKSQASSGSGIELRNHCLKFIENDQKDLQVHNSLSKFSKTFDVITMFHVLEHIPHQAKILEEIRNKIKPGGLLIVEVPHAEDFLIQSLNIPEFRSFTFWSEHLVLHTKKSLQTVLEKSGFKNVRIEGYQRFGFANHLRWFLDREPGGHELYKDRTDEGLENSYKASRISSQTSDTLIAYAYT